MIRGAHGIILISEFYILHTIPTQPVTERACGRVGARSPRGAPLVQRGCVVPLHVLAWMSQHGIEMQERLFVPEESDVGPPEPEPEPEPEPMVAPPELGASSDSNALIQSTEGGAATGEEQRPEAEPPRLSRDEELLDTATKMYRLGFCFLCVHRTALTAPAPRAPRTHLTQRRV
eukprot:COSAG02_NODE_2084_length_9892_cov_47.719085_13_plen_175_part_00